MSTQQQAVEQGTSVASPGIKIGTAWAAALGISSWGDVASVLAAAYTLILIGEWLWKKCGRQFAERHGWLQRRARRKEDRADC